MQNTKELSIEQRLEICKKCPIYSVNRGICNPKLYLNPDTGDVTTSQKPGYIRGCGCNVFFKAKNRTNHCNAGKW